MADDFKLSGKLELIGLEGADKYANELVARFGNLNNIASLSKNLDSTTTATRKATSETKNLATQIVSASTATQDFADKSALALRRFTAFTIAAGATYGAARLVVGGLKNAAQFERDLVKVKQVTDASTTSIAELQREITKLGTSLAAPASELLGVSKTLSQAGLSIEQVKTILEGLSRTRLASTFGDIENTTQGVIAIMGQFGVKANEVQDALALTSATAGKFAVESDGLITAVRQAGGAFSQASEGIDDSNTSLAKFYALVTSVSQVTRQSPATIATGLRTVIGRLQRPSTVNYFKDQGIDLRDSEGKFIGVFNALQKISQAYSTVNKRSEEFAKAVEVIGGARQYSIVVPLITQFAQQQEILNKSLAEQKNFLKETELPLNTLVEKFNILTNTWNAFSRDVYNSPVFQFLSHQALDLATSLVKVLDNISSLVPLLALIGGAKILNNVAREGALSVFSNRLLTGRGKEGIPHKATGGYVPGVGRGDKTLLMAEPGEFIIRRDAAEAIGSAKLNNLNKYASGGAVVVNDRIYELQNSLQSKFKIDASKNKYSNLTPISLHSNLSAVHDTLNRMSDNFSGLQENPSPLGLLFRRGKLIDNQSYGRYTRKSGIMDPFIQLAGGLSPGSGPLELGKESHNVGDASFDSTFAHEYGHHLHSNLDLNEKVVFSKIAKDYAYQIDGTSITAPKKGYPISQYAAKNQREVFAETFAAFTHPDYLSRKKKGTLVRQIPNDLELFMAKNFAPELLGKFAGGGFIDIATKDYFKGSDITNNIRALKNPTSRQAGNYFDALKRKHGENFLGVRGMGVAGTSDYYLWNADDATHHAIGSALGSSHYPDGILNSFDTDNKENLEGFTKFLKKQKGFKPGRKFADYGFATGGQIPGSGSGDKIPILAEPGEFVIRKAAAKQLGPDFLNQINHAEKFADGGFTDQPTVRQSKAGFLAEGKSLGISFTDLSKVVREVTKALESVPQAFKRTEASKLYGGALQSVNKTDSDLARSGSQILVTALQAASARSLDKAAKTFNNPAILGGGGTNSGNLNISPNAATSRGFTFQPGVIGSTVTTNRPSLFRDNGQLLLTDQRRKDRPLDLVPYGLGQNPSVIIGKDERFETLLGNEKVSGSYYNDTDNLLRKKFGDGNISDQQYKQYQRENNLGFGNKFKNFVGGGLRKLPTITDQFKNLTQPFSKFGGPQGLGLAAVLADDFLPKIGVPKRVSSFIGGALGGAAAGGFAGGAGGAILGGIYGGVSSLVSASHEEELDKSQKKLATTSKELDKAFLDLSENGLPKLNEILGRRIEAAQEYGAEQNKSFREQAIDALGGLDAKTTSKHILISSVGAGAGLGAFAAAGSTAIAAPVAIGLAAAYGVYGTAKGIAHLNTPYKRGESRVADFFTTDVQQIAPGREVNKKDYDTQKTVADLNQQLAVQSKEAIRKLLTKNINATIPDKLLEGAVSDDPLLNLGNRRGARYNALTEIVPKLKKEVEQQNNTLLAIKQIDNFQNRLERAVSALDVFNSKLDAGANDIQNIFNRSQGNYSINNAYVNPFNNIEGLNKDEISNAIKGLESSSGKSINADVKKSALAIPSIQSFTDILNDEIDKANKANGDSRYAGDTKSIALNLLSDKNGKLKDLPKQLRDEFTKIFENIDASQFVESLSENKKLLQGAEKNLTEGAKKYLQTLGDISIRIRKELDEDANLLGQGLAQRGQNSQNFENAYNQGIELRNNIRGERPDAFASIKRDENSIRALSAGSADPQQILQTIRNLETRYNEVRGSINADSSPQQKLDATRSLANLNSALVRNKQALDQLAQSAIGLTAIQNDLSDALSRREGAIGLSVNDLTPGNRKKNFDADLALSIFNSKRGNNLTDLAHGNLTPDDLLRGQQRKEERLKVFGSPKELEESHRDFGARLTKAEVEARVITPEEGSKRLEVINNKRISDLRDAVDTSVNKQLSAIEAQGKLLDDNIGKLDKTLENKFLNGISAFGKALESFQLPDKITMDVKHDLGSITVIGPNYNGLDKYIREIAEQTVNRGIAQLTEGRSSNGPTRKTNSNPSDGQIP